MKGLEIKTAGMKALEESVLFRTMTKEEILDCLLYTSSIEKVPETGDNTVTYAAAIVACIVLGGAVTVLIGARKKKGM